MAYVQRAGVAWTSAATGSANNTGSITCTAGNLLVWFAHYLHASAAQTVTVTGNGNTFVEVGAFRDATTGAGLRWGYAKNISGGAATYNGTFGAAVESVSFSVAEYSVLDPTTPYVSGEHAGQFSAITTSADSFSTGNATPAQEPFWIICAGFDDSLGGNLVAGTGFTQRATFADWYGGGNHGLLQDKRVTSLSALAGTMTGLAASSGVIGMIILRETGAAGGVGSLLSHSRNRLVQ